MTVDGQSVKAMTCALVATPASALHDHDGDRNLLRRISCADRDAFRQLYLDYHKRLARFLVRVIRNEDDLEEVINDALLVVWQRAGDFRGASRVSTWIFGIAYRCALKAIRRSTARSRVTALEFQDAEVAVEDSARETEDRQILDFGLSCLPLEQRLVLVLAYYIDYSCEQIAAIAECPVNTVKSRMLHARRKLRAVISAADAPQGMLVGGDGGGGT
jgi:RNA polymerase sigma-70 factor (ECF subfamily)